MLQSTGEQAADLKPGIRAATRLKGVARDLPLESGRAGHVRAYTHETPLSRWEPQ